MTETLSPDEREEYDALMHDAAFYPNGALVPTHLVASRAHGLLVNAMKAQRPWAELILESAMMDGLRIRVKRHVKTTNTTPIGLSDELTITRSSVYSTRHQTPTGNLWQPKLFEQMTKDDLLDLIASTKNRIRSEQINRSTFKRLVKIIDDTGAATVGDACTALGKSLEEVLAA